MKDMLFNPARLKDAPDVILKYKAADEVQNNTVAYLQDAALVFPVGVSQDWLFEVVLRMVSPAAAKFKLKFNGITSGGIILYKNASVLTPDDNLDGTTDQIATATTGINQMLHFWGIYAGGATGGSVQLNWGQNVATVGDTRVYAGSSLFARRIK